MSYRQAFIDSCENMAGCGNLRHCTSPQDWLEGLTLLANEETCPKDKVSSNTYLAIRQSDDELVGIIDFRHHINHPILSLWGGHIGYSIHPAERKKGYATEMLRQILIYCKQYGLDKVLVTCDHSNIGSRKTIIANGGVFETEVSVDDEQIQRYWIQL